MNEHDLIIGALSEQHKRGDPSALIHCVRYCHENTIKEPVWVREGLIQRARADILNHGYDDSDRDSWKKKATIAAAIEAAKSFGIKHYYSVAIACLEAEKITPIHKATSWDNKNLSRWWRNNKLSVKPDPYMLWKFKQDIITAASGLEKPTISDICSAVFSL